MLRLLAAIAVLTAAQPAAAQPAPAPARAYVVELLQTGPLPPDFGERLRPLKSLQAVEELLKANDLPFSWRKSEFSAATVGDRLMGQLNMLPPGEVFVIPRSGGGFVIGVIVARR